MREELRKQTAQKNHNTSSDSDKAARLNKPIKELVDEPSGLLNSAQNSLQKQLERLKAAQEAHYTCEMRYALVLEGARDGLWDRNLITGEVYFSPRWKKIIGFEDDEFPNDYKALIKRIHPDDLKRVQDTVQRHFRGETDVYLCDFRIKHRNGSYCWVLARGASRRDDSGKVIQFAGSHTDITQEKKLEEEMLKTQKLESVGLLAGGVAHDFNNLLTAIVGNISVAKECLNEQDEVFDMLTAAEKASFRARDLTKQLLTLSKGGAPAKKVSSVAQLIRETARLSLRGSNVNCRCHLPDKLWLAEIDEVQISQVISNLAINAKHAMPEGGIVTIKADNIIINEDRCRSLKNGKYIKIIIKDKGCGIKKENLHKIFEPYFTTKESGTGLGLATSFSIIKKHHGHIEIESEPDMGTKVQLYLPASTHKKLAAQKKETTRKFRGKSLGKILIMDDDEIVCQALELLLKKTTDYETVFAKDGAETIRLYKKAKRAANPFGAVIMDLTIPGGMGGKETIEKLKRFDPNVKAIVCSGYSEDPVMSDYRNYGFCDMLAKPYRIEDMKKKLENLITCESICKH
ncbi:MAG: PAS domain-containing protein [Proteobacteria bacterium]|nr:PAS domain-containing protein [Pseudomonadota bacterium]